MEAHNLDDSTAIVTGAVGDIGGGITRELAKAGCNITIADIGISEQAANSDSKPDNRQHARELADDLESLGAETLLVECDVTNAEQVEEMVETTVDELGTLDILASNAGIITYSPVEEMDEDAWDSVMDVNAKGIFLCARAAIPHLKDGGAIINTASIAGEIGSEGIGHYSASKHAVIGLTKTLALELAEDDVTVNALCPGIVDTPMWRDVLTPASEEAYEDTIQRSIPLHRDQKPEDMGRLVVFLAQNRNITGEAIKVDGGITQDVL
ncbi:SDR family NAD(P)-dependent oxidoreductase [Halostagnicola kamekurae]|uniref:Meso-butanediol dehydrogenase / (S,S)-butanediol dehydrogenase / diacetyl reductase n=1 Tax=Halostagnicola kamekurae TaxID=619731 RepID=A0A1I6TF24_9EURY|nr:SDR family NAD(P)-dependent oxidoreductase [Halostagnicola kamekurae]SFS87800.1 meso-butanediol dehydrogenase / (S,S)-butanediol dehydrogenase / diacetyl reductase [Halostagnicola kamekurae]